MSLTVTPQGQAANATLTEQALAGDTLQRGVVEIFARTSPVLELLPFMNITGNSYRYNQESTLPNVQFRNIGEGYTPSSGEVVQKAEGLMILGGDVDVDKFVVQTMSDVNSQRAIQTQLKSKAIAKTFTQKFFKGDSAKNPKEFDGLDVRIANNGNEIDNGGEPISLIKLHELLDAVGGGADVLFMSKAMRRELQRLFEEEKAHNYIEVGKDQFGRPVQYFGDVQIRTLDDDILPFAEEGGTGSIYAVRFGIQEAICGLTNGGVQVYDLGELAERPAYRTRIEFYCGLADFHPKAAARLKGIARKTVANGGGASE